MQIFIKQNLAMLAVPKTGSTAFEMALRREADIIFAKRRKHMTAGQFHHKCAPFLAEMYDARPERMAVMRDPVEQIRSWYRYRAAPRLKGQVNSAAGQSFDDFVRDVISDAPPPPAQIGSQHRFLTLSDGTLPLHHLFAYERQAKLRAFLEERFGKPLDIRRKNVSPPIDAPLSPEVAARLKAARPGEFALYDRLMEAGGHLRQSAV
ncbi:hypothetical protein SAMN04490248_11715 [Salinihabitans flavidus]|uniref:Sulfotransferase family protein n=1 Tax=Salinihabitans flavidus TaxID=569882 RepID=A0A1H8TVD9_9RHOB|nr:hypothetical protein [Salinihabitans flavidus]SEO94990.1 hypothetical protein SAMN04490248_11715 [Salinihabitans flavidus]